MVAITKPRADIPIAFVILNGQRVACETNPEFVRFFEELLRRAGGTSGAGTSDLELSAFEDAGIEESKAALFSVRDAVEQRTVSHEHTSRSDPSGEVSALREELTALRIRLDAIEQGTLQ